ncbi:hotdog fold thioesterase [Mariniluteicoccus flavus]
MSIWFTEPTPDAINGQSGDSLVTHLGIEFTGFTDDSLSARMPVDHRTHQPFGILHGGASVVLAETLASFGAVCTLDPAKAHAVGMEINANHLRPVDAGWVHGTATPVSLGRRTQVWEIRISNEAGKPVCISRCTMAVVEAPGGQR